MSGQVFTADGRPLYTLAQLAEQLDVPHATLRTRRKRGQLGGPTVWLDGRTPLWTKDNAMTPTLTITLARTSVPQVNEWQARPAGEERTQAARDAAATYATIATMTGRLARQYAAVSEAIAEQDVMGESSPEADAALATWHHEVPSDPAERARLSSMLADLAQELRREQHAADRESDGWLARIDELFLGEAGAL